MIEAVVFDFDGILVESVDIKTNAFARMFEAEGEDAVKKIVDYHLGHTGVSRFEKFRYFYRTILNRELTDEKFAELCRRFSDLVAEEVANAPYVRGAKEFLDEYYSAYRCYVASATPQPEIEDIIERRGMGRYFDGIYGSPRKKSDAVKEIIAGSRLSPDEIVFIGDAMSDYEAASVNGTHFIARVTDGGAIFKDIDCLKIKDLTGLKGLLDRIGNI